MLAQAKAKYTIGFQLIVNPNKDPYQDEVSILDVEITTSYDTVYSNPSIKSTPDGSNCWLIATRGNQLFEYRLKERIRSFRILGSDEKSGDFPMNNDDFEICREIVDAMRSMLMESFQTGPESWPYFENVLNSAASLLS